MRWGFDTIKARDIDRIGVGGLIKELKESVGITHVYISINIVVHDPAFAPATGTAEVGRWTTRELLSVSDGLEGTNVIGAKAGQGMLMSAWVHATGAIQPWKITSSKVQSRWQART